MSLTPPPPVGSGYNAMSTAGFPSTLSPFPSVQPFSYPDGLTFQKLFEHYRMWLLDNLVPHVDAQSDAMIDAYNTASAALDSAMSDYTAGIITDRTAFETVVSAIRNATTAARDAAKVSADVAKGSEIATQLWSANQFNSDATTTVAALNEWLAIPTKGVKRLSGIANINAALIIPSDTKLDASQAVITSTFVGNMIRNTNALNTGTRDKNIQIMGGTWQRNAGGPAATAIDGSANGAHSIFMRHVDGLKITDLTVGSTGGKYMIAIGDVTNFRVADINGTTLSSDTVHMTGPVTNGVVERVTVGSGGDDVVAITTTDYPAYSDTHGSATDITIRNVKGGNTTRTVLLAGASYAQGTPDGHTLDRIVVDGVVQTGTGAAVWTGAGGNTDVFGSLDLAHIYGGAVQLRHPNHTTVTVRDAPKGIVPTTQDTNTACNIAKLVYRDTILASGTAVLVNNINVNIDNLEISNVTSKFDTFIIANLGIIGRLLIRNSTYTGTNNFMAIGGATIGSIVLDSFVAVMNAATTHMIRLSGNGSVGSVTYTDCDITGVNTSTAILVIATSATNTVGSVYVNRGRFNTIGRIVDIATGITNAVTVRVTDAVFNVANRLAQTNGAPLDFGYSNLKLSGIVNQPIQASGGSSVTVSGGGWSGYTGSAVSRSGTETVRSLAPDFPVDLSILAKVNGDVASNTNAALACGVGKAITNGTSWKNQYSGTTY